MQTESSEQSVARTPWWAPLGFLGGLVLMLTALYVLGKPFYADEDLREDHRKVRELDEARYIVLGSSHGRDVDLEALGVEGQNLSHNGQDLFEMAYIARSAAARAPKLETVIVVLSYFTFAMDNAAFERSSGVRDRIGRRIQMYSAFPRAAFVPGDHAEYVKGLLYPIVTRDHFEQGFKRNARRLLRLFTGKERTPRDSKRSQRAAAKARERRAAPRPATDTAADIADDANDTPDGDLLDDPEPDEDSDSASEPERPSAPDRERNGPESSKGAERAKRRTRTVRNEAWYAQHASSRCRHYSMLMDNMRAHHPDLERDTYDELLRLVRDLEAKHLSVVLVTPPYLSVYTACFDARMQRLTRTNATRVTQVTGARYFDLSTDAAFANKASFFSDSDHLRKEGKVAVARKLAGLLGLKKP